MKHEYLLVDGYNVIFAWDELKNLAEDDLEFARDKLLDMMCNFQGHTGNTVIVVFDAHRIKGGKRSIIKHNNIFVAYTNEAETADHFIEKTVKKLAKDYQVRVATSDFLEQVIIMGKKAIRVSARELLEEVRSAEKLQQPKSNNNIQNQAERLRYAMDQETYDWFQKMRKQ